MVAVFDAVLRMGIVLIGGGGWVVFVEMILDSDGSGSFSLLAKSF